MSLDALVGRSFTRETLPCFFVSVLGRSGERESDDGVWIKRDRLACLHASNGAARAGVGGGPGEALRLHLSAVNGCFI